MMAQMEPVQVDFPPEWDESIRTRLAERGKASVAEYLRDLVADDILPAKSDEQIDRLIEEGLQSPVEGPVDAAFWAERRRKLREAVAVNPS